MSCCDVCSTVLINCKVDDLGVAFMSSYEGLDLSLAVVHSCLFGQEEFIGGFAQRFAIPASLCSKCRCELQ